jgi:hypothetical protein
LTIGKLKLIDCALKFIYPEMISLFKVLGDMLDVSVPLLYLL